jgi:hypothetical protein
MNFHFILTGGAYRAKSHDGFVVSARQWKPTSVATEPVYPVRVSEGKSVSNPMTQFQAAD